MATADGPSRSAACNIGPMEIRRRRRGGYALLAAGVVLAVALVAVGVEPLLRLAVAAPFSAGMVAWLQARRRLCVAFAALGVRNLGSGSERERVEGPDVLRADRAAAFRLVRDGTAAGVVIAVLVALLPV